MIFLLLIRLEYLLASRASALQGHATNLLSALRGLGDWAECSEQLRVQFVGYWLNQRTLYPLKLGSKQFNFYQPTECCDLLDFSLFELFWSLALLRHHRLRNSIIIQVGKSQNFTSQVNFQRLVLLNLSVVTFNQIDHFFVLLDKLMLAQLEVVLLKQLKLFRPQLYEINLASFVHFAPQLYKCKGKRVLSRCVCILQRWQRVSYLLQRCRAV